MVKTNGAEWNRFYNDNGYWGNGQWHDDVVITVDGEEAEDYDRVKDSAVVTIDGGVVFMGPDDTGEKAPSMEIYFRRWKKSQTTTSIAVECPKDKLAAVTAAVRAAGGKVI